MKSIQSFQTLFKTILLLGVFSLSHAQNVDLPVTIEPTKTESSSAQIESNVKLVLDSPASAEKTPVVVELVTSASVTPQITQTNKPYSERVKLMSTTGVGVSRTAGDEHLRVVTKGNTGAGLALSIFTSVLSGGLNASAFKKENLHGTKVDTIKHPAFTGLKTQIEASVDAYLDNPNSKKPAQFKNTLALEANQLLLVYSSLTAETTAFELRVMASLSKKAESAGFFTGPKSIPCSFVTPEAEALPLEKWEANNYALVKAKLTLFEANCAREFSEKINILLAD